MTSRINVSKADILDNPGKLDQNIRLLVEFEAFEDITSGKLFFLKTIIILQKLNGNFCLLNRMA